MYGTTYIGSVRWNDRQNSGVWGTMGGSVTNFGHYGFFAQWGYGAFFVQGDFYQHYDFTNFDRMSLGAGVLVKL